MRATDQSKLADRLLGHIDHGTTDLADHTAVCSADAYRDDRLYRSELDSIFQRCPVAVAHVTQLAMAGDCVVGDLYGIPFVLVRQASGEIRGFVNLCRHRGTRVVGPGTLRAAADGFTCPWHGWRYRVSGELCGIPDEQRGFPDVDPAQYGLLRLRTEVRHGFIWVTPTAPGPDSVADHLGPLDDELAAYELDTYTFYGASARAGHFNWKLGIEAFLETYHFRWLHPAMKKYVFAPDLSLVDALGLHVRLVAPKKSVLENRELEPVDRTIREHATIAYIVFPSTVIFIEKRHVTVMSMRPTAVDSCDVRFLHIVQEDTLHRRPYWDENIGKFMDAAAEDWVALEHAQNGMGRPDAIRYPGIRTVLFGRNESGLQIFRGNVDAALARGQE